MFLAIALTLALECKPAQFVVNVETNTQVSLFINGTPIEAGTIYRTEPLLGKTCVEVTVNYIDGSQVKTKTFWMDIEPGYTIRYTLSIHANPPIVMMC